jgi:hypothetical protein
MSDLRPIRNTAHTLTVAAATLATAAVLAGCGTGGIAPTGSATLSTVMTPAQESNPAGDIPDNQAFVPLPTVQVDAQHVTST